MIGDFFDLGGRVRLQGHLLPIIDEPIVLMFVSDGGLEPGILFNLGRQFEGRLGHNANIDIIASIVFFLKVIFLKIDE